MSGKDKSITPELDAGQSLTGMFDLTGQVGFIPGGYGGLGEAIAYGLSMHGARGGDRRARYCEGGSACEAKSSRPAASKPAPSRST